jgi:hypothetical protein
VLPERRPIIVRSKSAVPDCAPATAKLYRIVTKALLEDPSELGELTLVDTPNIPVARFPEAVATSPYVALLQEAVAEPLVTV